MGSRAFDYSDDVATKVCLRLALGETLNKICLDREMPSTATVKRWAVEDINGFGARYARAREMQVEYYADDIIDISDSVRDATDNATVQAAKLAADNRKWLASKLYPRKFGDRLEMTGANGAALIPERAADPDRIAQAIMLMAAAPGARPKPALIEHRADDADDDNPAT
jgi:hypothetical protein